MPQYAKLRKLELSDVHTFKGFDSDKDSLHMAVAEKKTYFPVSKQI